MATSVWMIDAGERYILCILVDLGSYVLTYCERLAGVSLCIVSCLCNK